jgi:hypothetical protein
MEFHPELTNFNGAVFDLLRLKHHGEKMPYWLCMSEEAKFDAACNFAGYCRGMSSKMQNMTNQYIIEFINKTISCSAIDKWKEREMAAKANRDAGKIDYFI